MSCLVLAAGLAGGAPYLRRVEPDLAPHLGEEAIDRIVELTTPPFRGNRFEELEKEYQELVQPQTLADLRQIYDPANQSRLRITYPTFIAEDGLPGHDLGFGLHVVKRLVLPMEGGRTKVIDVNEAWPTHRGNGGLFLPDEIRIKTQVFDGERRVVGSQKLYLFDSIRLAWGPRGEVSLHRRSRYEWNDELGVDHRRAMRVPVSAPISCLGCHNSPSELAPPFAKKGEAINHEAIVQDSYFARPPERTFGFRRYLAHLERMGNGPGALAAARTALADPATHLRVPGLYEALGRALARPSVSWLPGDDFLTGVEPETAWKRQGVYERDGYLFVDALESVHPGKYAGWEPRVVLPRLSLLPRALQRE